MEQQMETRPVAVADLNLYYKNPRLGDVDTIAESLEQNGQYRAIVVNRGTHTGRPMEVLAGNHTVKAAKRLGWDTILAHVLDVNEDDAARIVLVDNRSSDLAKTDFDVLLEVTDSLEDLLGTGYSTDDLDAIRGADPKELLTGDDDVPEVDEAGTSRVAVGDIWQMGDHFLACGDTTDGAVWAALMGSDVADVVWTDPPYGVDYVGKTDDKLTIKNDSKDGLKPLLDASFKHLFDYARPGCPVYVAHADMRRVTFENAFVDAGFIFRQNLIWVKNTIVMGRSDYHWQHEPILYGFKPAPSGSGRLGRGGDRWYGDDSQSTVMEAAQALVAYREGTDKESLFFVDTFALEEAIAKVEMETTVLKHDKPAASKLHPTMKPVGLVIQMLLNSAKRGDIIVDPFVGSGSTLIAAEKLGLRARVIELEPEYAEVVLQRWEEATGGKAQKVGEGV